MKVKKWVKELRKIVGNDITIAIAGNKIDLEKNRHVDEKEAQEYVKWGSYIDVLVSTAYFYNL